jgi:hypothetical protein
MSNNMNLTETQVRNLLKNAYGFVDEHGVLFPKNFIHHTGCEFELIHWEHSSIRRFTYDNAKFENSTVTFETLDGQAESFTVLILAAMPVEKVHGSSNIPMHLFEAPRVVSSIEAIR